MIDEADAKNNGGEDAQKSGNRTSYGGFLNVSPVPHILPNLLLGLGGNYSTFHDIFTDPTTHDYDRTSNLQFYGAAQYLVHKQLFIKLVVGYAKSHLENSNTGAPYDDDMFSVRVRVMYLVLDLDAP